MTLRDFFWTRLTPKMLNLLAETENIFNTYDFEAEEHGNVLEHMKSARGNFMVDNFVILIEYRQKIMRRDLETQACMAVAESGSTRQAVFSEDVPWNVKRKVMSIHYPIASSASCEHSLAVQEVGEIMAAKEIDLICPESIDPPPSPTTTEASTPPTSSPPLWDEWPWTPPSPPLWGDGTPPPSPYLWDWNSPPPSPSP